MTNPESVEHKDNPLQKLSYLLSTGGLATPSLAYYQERQFETQKNKNNNILRQYIPAGVLRERGWGEFPHKVAEMIVRSS